VAPEIESNIGSLKGGGRPLAESARSFFEPRFFADFSGVRIHSDNAADALAEVVQARAFTIGSDIFFRGGEYAPATADGNNLLAHELTHVVQQTNTVSRRRMLPARINTDEDNAMRSTAAADLLPPAARAADNQAFFRKEIDDFHRSRSVESRTLKSIRPRDGIGTVIRQSPLPDIQRQHKLETDLGSAAGLTCPISTEKLNHQNASLDITFDLGGSVLTAEDINNITVFVNNWRGASVSVPVRIHGYASKDGPPTLNWPLSCRRAEAVSKQMQKVQPAVVLSTGQAFPAGTPGIPAGFIDTFAHGETEEFSKTALPPNRRSTAHVPSLPSLPAKVAKSPTARLKSGPTYTPNGTIKATATALKKSAAFRMSAEFDHDPPNGVLSACGQVRQYIRWSSNNVDPARFGHEGFFTDKTYLPDTWYEDRAQNNIRYGHRSGPHFFNGGGGNQYLDAKGKQDFLNGPIYQGRDGPNTAGPAAYIASFVGTWEFRLDAIDTCRGSSVLGSDTVKIVW
jgi:outer membrane protein OmpA-like peptidoglycan-associated protein